MIVGEAGVLESDYLSDGVVAALGLWYPHVTLLAPAGHQDLVAHLPLVEGQLPGAGVQPHVDGHGPTDGLREVEAVLVCNTGILEVKPWHVTVDPKCGSSC